MANLAGQAAQTALEDLTDRALTLADNRFESFVLPPLAAAFLKRAQPQVVAQTANRLKDSVYAFVLENGRYDNYDGFPNLEAEWTRIATALPHFIAGENSRLQSVCAALDQFLNFSGRWDERLSLSLQAEEKAVAAKNFERAGWRAYQAGWVYHLRYQAAEVLACAARAASHWGEAKAGAREKAFAIRLRGLGHELEKNYPAAIAAYKEALELRRALSPESEDVAIVLNDLAGVEHASKHYASAERDYREALRIDKKNNDHEGMATDTGNLAGLALDREQWAEAEQLAREALELAEKVGRTQIVASNSSHLAKALARQGRKSEGLPYAQRAVEIYVKLKSPDLERAKDVLRECEE
jgi:tetratricopeptide (TPR) repeat protein